MSNELDEIEKFLKLSPDDTPDSVTSTADIKIENGVNHTEPEDVSLDDNEAEAKQEPQKEDDSLSEKPVGENEVTASETDNQNEKEEEKVEEEEEEKVEDETEDADNNSNKNNEEEEETA